jgi:hypothetical protein
MHRKQSRAPDASFLHAESWTTATGLIEPPSADPSRATPNRFVGVPSASFTRKFIRLINAFAILDYVLAEVGRDWTRCDVRVGDDGNVARNDLTTRSSF